MSARNSLNLSFSRSVGELVYLLVGPTVFCGKFSQILRASMQNSTVYRDKIVQILRLTAAFRLWLNGALFCSETSVIDSK